MKKIWKLCAFLPALFMMGVIFSFSAQTGTQSGSLSHDISVRVVETKGRQMRLSFISGRQLI